VREAWLLSDGKVLASAEVAETAIERARGLIGRRDYDGAMVFPRTRSVHSVGMRFPLDVGFLDTDLVVIDIARLDPWRVVLPRRRARTVVESTAGSFERWGMQVGDRLELR